MAAPQTESRHRSLSQSAPSRTSSSPGVALCDSDSSSAVSPPAAAAAVTATEAKHGVQRQSGEEEEQQHDGDIRGQKERTGAEGEGGDKSDRKKHREGYGSLKEKENPKHHHHHHHQRAAAVCAEYRKEDFNPDLVKTKKSSTGPLSSSCENLSLKPKADHDNSEDQPSMYWAADSQQPPPPSTHNEERIPIIARRRSSGEVEVLGWCSRARLASNSNSRASTRPQNSPTERDHGNDGESANSSQRNLSLPWTNHRLLPEYPVLASSSWSTASSSSSSSSSSLNHDFGTFSNNTSNENPFRDDDDDSDDDSDEHPLLPPPSEPPQEEPVTWLSLPHKSQLIILALCRFSEPLTATSVTSYLYYLLSSFHPPGSPPPPTATIARQAGILASCFALAQCLTGILWGRLSDRIGRKPCILLGLAGTIFSVVGFGFSESLAAALTFRILGGCLNGNGGVLRTMVTEVIVEKKYQSRAFLIMPMCFNIGIIVGPMLGGLLADPTVSWPGLFGGIAWLERWRFALPNLVSAGFLAGSWIAGFLFLRETHESKKYNRDIGIELRKSLVRRFKQLHGTLKGKHPANPPTDLKGDYQTTSLLSRDEELTLRTSTPRIIPPRQPTPFRKIFTPTIISTLLNFAIIPFHNATFMQLWGIFLSTPRGSATSFFAFTGGLGLPARQVGLAMSYLGTIGILIQVLCYPPLQAKLGLLRSFRLSCLFFPVAYTLTPFLARLPSAGGAGEPASGWVVWTGIVVVLMLQVTARTFALPGSVILLTNSVEDRGVLGTVHGCGVSLASASRAVGPALGGALYAAGLEGGVVGVVFWGMAGVAGMGAWRAWFLKEGRGISAEVEEEREGEGEGEGERLLGGEERKRGY